MKMSLPDYAELLCCSNFTFLRGASHPGTGGARPGHGLHRPGHHRRVLHGRHRAAHVAAKKHGLPLIVGSQFRVQARDGVPPATSPGAAGHQPPRLRQPLRVHHAAAALGRQGHVPARAGDVDPAALADCLAIAVPPRGATQDQCDATARWLLGAFLGRCWLGVTQLRLTGRRSTCTACARPARSRPCRWWRWAMCTCTCARASRCRTC
jgi:error-prone DNA polymerase